ncbi:unnamed protein product [Cyprideis torosa]|uniref:Uncharacterized protein n=1 Tax=Cyprideis torosa TaxID=163714 RepID=A0A7R8WLV3_9CRUS|nr:unnamed protein product [Cyprideis torosa]CAG0898664.1 unnamed protein product [Cyprideis torosa]
MLNQIYELYHQEGLTELGKVYCDKLSGSAGNNRLENWDWSLNPQFSNQLRLNDTNPRTNTEVLIRCLVNDADDCPLKSIYKVDLNIQAVFDDMSSATPAFGPSHADTVRSDLWNLRLSGSIKRHISRKSSFPVRTVAWHSLALQPWRNIDVSTNRERNLMEFLEEIEGCQKFSKRVKAEVRLKKERSCKHTFSSAHVLHLLGQVLKITEEV